jgi:hypothetical protein
LGYFSRNWLDTAAMYWSWTVVVAIMAIAYLLSMLLYLPMAASLERGPGIGFAVGGVTAVLMLLAYGEHSTSHSTAHTAVSRRHLLLRRAARHWQLGVVALGAVVWTLAGIGFADVQRAVLPTTPTQ